MDKENDILDKGEALEEKLREYFLNLGYYVMRGAKLKFHSVVVTDIDLWVYHRSTPITRERINVDIKNKNKQAGAIERIIVAKGLKDILGNDRCIVATTDKREDVIEFGEKHGVIVLNGNILQRIKLLPTARITEENISQKLKNFNAEFGLNWLALLENSKSRLLQTIDFAITNEILLDMRVVLEEIHSNSHDRQTFIRLLYILLSHLLITIDFILKDMAFIEPSQKLKNLAEGFRYGAIGNINIKLRIEKIASDFGRSASDIRKAADSTRSNILTEFFGKNEVGRNLFRWAKEFEAAAYTQLLVQPNSINIDLKSIIGLICDSSNIDRKFILTL